MTKETESQLKIQLETRAEDLPARAPESDVARYIREYLAELPTGHIAYAVPDKPLQMGKVHRFEARVARSLSNALTEGLERLGTPEVKDLKVDTFMKLTLEGTKFDIKLEGGPEAAKKIVDEEAHWIWHVTPQEAGVQELALIAYVRIKLPNGQEESKEYEVFRRPFTVRVDWMDSAKAFAMGNWQYLVTTLLGGGGIFAAYKKWRDRRKPPLAE